MKRLLISIAAMLYFCQAMLCGPITQNEALAKALLFNKEAIASRIMRAPSKTTDFKLAYSLKDKLNENTFIYIFNRGKADGYILVSGDDRAKSILGYSDSGDFNYQKLPINMRRWLDNYARQIQYLMQHSELPAGKQTNMRNEGKSVGPLLKTYWAQVYPYNLLCPIRETDKRTCATGCVATAMAEVMFYHKWPVKGKGSHSYTSLTNHYNLSADFGNTVYDWDNMHIAYDDEKYNTEVANKAVATLMFHAGVSVDMDYNLSSGAFSQFIAPSLLHYFNYDKGLNIVLRDYIGAAWDSILRNELDNGRPVIYDGSTKDYDGHSFVCDGYNSEGYFHIDWGWDGVYNGYFLTTALDPAGQGTGGSSSGEGFDYYQDMIIGIQKPKEDSKVVYRVICDTTWNIRQKVARNESVKLCIRSFWNCTTDTLDFDDCAYVLFDKDGQEVASQTLFKGSIPGGRGKDSIAIAYSIPTSVPNGDYKAYLCYRLTDETIWRKVEVPLKMPRYVQIHISDEAIGYEAEDPTGLTGIEADNTEIHINNPIHTTLHIQTESPIKTIRIYNTSGQLLQEQTFNAVNAISLDLSSYKAACYLIQINTLKGRQTKRIIKLQQ